MNLPLGSGGAFSVALAPNAGATPDGTFYKVVLKLDEGTTETETWVIPSSSTAANSVSGGVMPSTLGALTCGSISTIITTMLER